MTLMVVQSGGPTRLFFQQACWAIQDRWCEVRQNTTLNPPLIFRGMPTQMAIPLLEWFGNEP